MFATLLLSTHFRRRLPVWLGVTAGYAFHVLIAVIFGSALSQLPEKPIQLLVAILFIVGGVLTWRAGDDDDHESQTNGQLQCRTLVLPTPQRQ